MSVFHAYDVRGLIGSEVNEALAFRVGAAMVRFTGVKTLVVGRDMRESGIAFFEALTQGIASEGGDIIDIGLCSTPLFYFGVNQFKTAGIMITASHNPAQYNGFKLMNAQMQPIGEGSGIDEIERLCAQIEVKTGFSPSIRSESILPLYVQKLLSLVDIQALEGMRVCVDAGNGMGGYTAPALFHALPVVMHPLYFDLDGNFPNHEANPIKYETLAELSKLVKTSFADIGVAYDGDADRVGFLDERGVPIAGDIVTALLAREMILKHGPGTVLFDVRSTRAIKEIVEAEGGAALMTKVGHARIKKHMVEVNALFGGELSSHFYFAEFSNNESTEYAILLMMSLIIEEGRPLSEIVAEVSPYAHSGELNFTVSDKAGAIEALKQAFSEGGEVSTIDGVRVDFEDWWWNIRPSNTEPVLRLTLEAVTSEEMEEKKTLILDILKRFIG